MLPALAAGACGDSPAPPQPAPPADPPAAVSPEVEHARCPADVAGCRSATGSIIYVERVDPDGDGDAHFVLLDAKGITAPGVSVVDVAVDLRPRPLPDVGETISAAGPVRPGSYGQRQIEAYVLNVAR